MYRQVEAQVQQAIAKLILHSVNPMGQHLWTFQLEFPRLVHQEFLTHRKKSRNASSSRAIPVQRMIDSVRRNPGMPAEWGRNQPGMQSAGSWDAPVEVPMYLWPVAERLKISTKGLTGAGFLVTNEEGWRIAANAMADLSQAYDEAGYHKQVANRFTDTFQLIKVVCSTTDLAHFMGLRKHPMADPTIRCLAEAMDACAQQSEPQPLDWGQWHLPYIRSEDEAALDLMLSRIRVSTARCARVSYDRHDGEPNSYDADFGLHDRLLVREQPHESPAEHQAIALSGSFSNFDGFCSYRWQHERGVLMTRQ